MHTVRTLFPGAMGPDGFISCFDHLMPEHLLRRKLILKGGPGVGKSTFMRRLHAALCEEARPAALYFCSGDPDSLDAVAITHAGLLVVDGTAPHVVDPLYPGARDSIINLGVCLDEAALRPRLPHIRTCMADHAAASRRARAALQAARPLEQDAAVLLASCMDSARLSRMTRALSAAVFTHDAAPADMPSVHPVITDAFTPKGELCLLSEQPDQRVIRLSGRAGLDLTDVLREISRTALAAGFSVEEHLSAAVPGRLLHLTIPALNTLITTGDLLPAEQTFDFSAAIPAGALLRHECALEQLMAGVSRHRRHAVAALAQAKQLHDELETFYVPSMDFARWQSIFEETLAVLEC